ncbi:hypothetical protein HOI18_02095 [Candidatus Uhrbacteria bacterium]|nr:hypothetical protein [Candidatus Uhrbacteria bacterium]
MLVWICRECGDGNLPPNIFKEIEDATNNEEVRKIVAMHEVVVKVCEGCQLKEGVEV